MLGIWGFKQGNSSMNGDLFIVMFDYKKVTKRKWDSYNLYRRNHVLFSTKKNLGVKHSWNGRSSNHCLPFFWDAIHSFGSLMPMPSHAFHKKDETWQNIKTSVLSWRLSASRCIAARNFRENPWQSNGSMVSIFCKRGKKSAFPGCGIQNHEVNSPIDSDLDHHPILFNVVIN